MHSPNCNERTPMESSDITSLKDMFDALLFMSPQKWLNLPTYCIEQWMSLLFTCFHNPAQVVHMSGEWLRMCCSPDWTHSPGDAVKRKEKTQWWTLDCTDSLVVASPLSISCIFIVLWREREKEHCVYNTLSSFVTHSRFCLTTIQCFSTFTFFSVSLSLSLSILFHSC